MYLGYDRIADFDSGPVTWNRIDKMRYPAGMGIPKQRCSGDFTDV